MAGGSDAALLDFCRRLPKVELHAHLNGSVTVETLRRLAAERRATDPHFLEGEEDIETSIARIAKLGDFFPLFGVVYRITNNVASVRRCVEEVLDDFLNDGVRYLELRTGPREVQATNMTRRAYLEAVLDTMAAHHAQNPELVSRLIVSIDRKVSLEAALETVELAAELVPRGVVGVDLCGDPLAAPYAKFQPALARARELGLPVVIHMAEVPDSDGESMQMLDDGIARIGHGTFMGPEVCARVARQRTPLEICLTSNLKCATVPSADAHHFREWYAAGHPAVLCTDDKGIFGAELSQEYALAARTFGLSHEQLFRLSEAGIDAILAGDSVKEHLRRLWRAAAGSLLPN